MKDRQPTKVLSNGAIRYGIYREDGTLDHYEYLKREDEPTVEGTPLNKANLLSDATAAKLWPNADTRPEDPTINDALGKLAQGTDKVGDIAITARTDLSGAWLPCDGRTVSQEEYPELCSVLRTPSNPDIWNSVIVNTEASRVSKGFDMLSYANGVWFRSYTVYDSETEAYRAKLFYSADRQNWTEWAMTPFPELENGRTHYIAAMNKMHYYNGMWVCAVWVFDAFVQAIDSIKEGMSFGIVFSDAPGGAFSLDLLYNGSHGLFANQTLDLDSATDVYWCDNNYVVPNVSLFRTAISYKARLQQNYDASTWNTVDSPQDYSIVSVVQDASSNLYYLVGADTYQSSNGNYYGNTYVCRLASLILPKQLAYLSLSDVNVQDQSLVSNWMTPRDAATVKCMATDPEGIVFRGQKDTSGSNYAWVRCASGSTQLQTLAAGAATWDNMIYSDGLYIDSAGSAVHVTDDIETGWDSTINVEQTLADISPAIHDQVSAMAVKSTGGSVVKIIWHNFAYDNKKIPNITPDARSHAYIKSLEE